MVMVANLQPVLASCQAKSYQLSVPTMYVQPVEVHIPHISEVKTRRESPCLEHLDSSLKRTRPRSCSVHDCCFQLHNIRSLMQDSQQNVPDWTPGVKANICKTAADCLPRNSSSRRSRNVTSKLRSHCPPMSSCA
ncbi:hypothetical protein TNCV_247441 [Trichonephila clavipes]|nr:hypothetical protein TNCV_247441 [Trichonephila clavipes]